MDSNTKQLMAVFSLMLGLSWGIPYFVSDSDERNAGWLMLAVVFLLIAILFYMWIMREQDSSEEAATKALDAAEENLKKLEAQAAEADAASTPVEEVVAEPEPEPVAEVVAEPEPEPVAEAVAEPEPEPEPAAEAVAEPEPVASDEPDDLTRIEGIGPKYSDILTDAGITTFEQIAAMTEDEIIDVIKSNGGRKSASMATWAEQAKFAAANDWDGLDALQEELKGGRRD